MNLDRPERNAATGSENYSFDSFSEKRREEKRREEKSFVTCQDCKID